LLATLFCERTDVQITLAYIALAYSAPRGKNGK